MPGKPRKKNRKRTRYTKVTIKLTTRQKKSLFNYCNARQTTPNKLIKKSIRRFINGFDKEIPDEYYITENQLDLFEEPEDMLDDIEVEELETDSISHEENIKPKPLINPAEKPILPRPKGRKRGMPSLDLFSNDYVDM